VSPCRVVSGEPAARFSDTREACLTRVRSHIVTIPPGPHLLSDLVATSPILQGEGGAVGAAGADGFPPDFEDVPGGAAAAGGADEFGGIDPNMDPELAMVRVTCGSCLG
jgi:26S proteasome regulatory subunit N10